MSICCRPTLFMAICFLVFLGSCDSMRSEIDPSKLLDQSPRVVVTCFISPQDLVLAAKINQTKTILGQLTDSSGTNTITDAIVTLSQGSQSVTLRYDSAQDIYQADIKQLPIVAGRTYTLRVQRPTGNILTSSCVIPEPVKQVSAVFDSLTDDQAGHLRRRYFVRVNWRDPAGQSNFYQVTGLFRSVANQPADGPKQAEEVREIQFDSEENSVQDDGGAQGRLMSSMPGFLYNVYMDEQPKACFRSHYQRAFVILNLLNTDKTYYTYQNSINRQVMTTGNPFAEPISLPSNIQGGLGCFAGYNRSTLTMNLK